MDPQQVYVDTTNGALSYLTPASTPSNTFSAGAIVVNFLHLGQGTNLTSPIPGEDPNLYVTAGPGTCFPLLCTDFSHWERFWKTGFDEELGSFNWLGSDNSGWFLCPQKASRNSTVYQVMKEVTVHDQRQIGCLSGIALIAIDYFSASPVTGVYLWIEEFSEPWVICVSSSWPQVVMMSATC